MSGYSLDVKMVAMLGRARARQSVSDVSHAIPLYGSESRFKACRDLNPYPTVPKYVTTLRFDLRAV